MKKEHFLLLFGLLLLLITGCKKDVATTTSNMNFGYTYFPNQVGLTRIYQVDSIFWDDFNNTHDTVSYKLKEVIDSNYLDNQQRITQRISRYKLDSLGNWIIYKVWASNRTITTAERVEDNNRYIKLVFPPKLTSKWNGNSENTLDEEDYQITALNVHDNINTLSFDSTVTVLQIDDDNLVSRMYGVEKFAAGVGLYYRQNINQIYVFPTSVIQSGYIYTESLISYSNTP